MDSGDGVALVVEQHVGWVEVHANVGPVQLLEEVAERRGVLLAGLERDVEAEAGEQVGSAGDAIHQLRERGIGLLVGKESGVERHELEAEVDGDAGVGLEVPPVLFPRGVRYDTAGDLDGVQSRVVLADGGHHAGEEADAALGAEAGGLTPGSGILAEGIEMELQGPDAGAGEAFEEFRRRSGLEGPGADSGAVEGRGRGQRADEAEEPGGLPAQAGHEFLVVQSSIGTDQLVDARYEDPFRIDVGVAIAEHALEVFDGTEATPLASRQADERNGATLEGGGKGKEVDEVLECSGIGAVVFRDDDDQAAGLDDGVGGRGHRRRPGGIGSRAERVGGEVPEVDDVQGFTEFGVEFGHLPRDAGGVGAGAIGSYDQRNHVRIVWGSRMPLASLGWRAWAGSSRFSDAQFPRLAASTPFCRLRAPTRRFMIHAV